MPLTPLFDLYDTGDEIRRAPVLPPDEIILDAVQGAPVTPNVMRTDEPGMAAVQQPTIDISSVLGPRPEIDERRQRISRLLSLGGALATVLTGGEGSIASIGAGLTQGGAQAVRQGEVRYAQALQARQEQAADLAGINRDIQAGNIDRRASLRQFQREQAAEQQATTAEQQAEAEAAQLEFQRRQQLEELQARLDQVAPGSLEAREVESRIAENEAQASSARALASQRAREDNDEGDEAEIQRELDEARVRRQFVEQQIEAIPEEQRTPAFDTYAELVQRRNELGEDIAVLESQMGPEILSPAEQAEVGATTERILDIYRQRGQLGGAQPDQQDTYQDLPRGELIDTLHRQLLEGTITNAQANAILNARGL